MTQGPAQPLDSAAGAPGEGAAKGWWVPPSDGSWDTVDGLWSAFCLPPPPPGAAVQRDSSGQQGQGTCCPGPGMGYPCAERRGPSAVPGHLAPDNPRSTGRPRRDMGSIVPSGRDPPTQGGGALWAPLCGQSPEWAFDLGLGVGAGEGRGLFPWLPCPVSHPFPILPPSAPAPDQGDHLQDICGSKLERLEVSV